MTNKFVHDTKNNSDGSSCSLLPYYFSSRMRHVSIFLKTVAILFMVAVMWSFCRVSSRVPDAEMMGERIAVLKQQYNIEQGSIVYVDFSKPSCEDRLYIYTGEKSECVYSGVVLHGMGGNSTDRVPDFSNEEGSNCSSLGMYKVAESGRMWRVYPCMRLDGLDSTNSNARKRGILLHPSVKVTLLPFEIWDRCFKLSTSSQGCFSVSLHTYFKINKLKRPIYIYGTL